MSAPECRSDHSSCLNKTKPSTSITGYVCRCSNGYQGNPYVPDGCQGIYIYIVTFCDLYIPSAARMKNLYKITSYCYTVLHTNISHACTFLDIDECRSPGSYPCYGNCSNTPGSFICQCPAGYTGNASRPDGCKGITIIQISFLCLRLFLLVYGNI